MNGHATHSSDRLKSAYQNYMLYESFHVETVRYGMTHMADY